MMNNKDWLILIYWKIGTICMGLIAAFGDKLGIGAIMNWIKSLSMLIILK